MDIDKTLLKHTRVYCSGVLVRSVSGTFCIFKPHNKGELLYSIVSCPYFCSKLLYFLAHFFNQTPSQRRITICKYPPLSTDRYSFIQPNELRQYRVNKFIQLLTWQLRIWTQVLSLETSMFCTIIPPIALQNIYSESNLCQMHAAVYWRDIDVSEQDHRSFWLHKSPPTVTYITAECKTSTK